MSYPTWSDLNSPSIVPPLGARQAPDIGPAALMVSTVPDLRYLSNTRGDFSGSEFFMGRLMTGTGANSGMSIAGPYMGAPYAVMLMESLIARGADRIVILGWCGAVSGDFSPGDLIVPDRAMVDEGTSRHYTELTGNPAVTVPDPGVSERLVSFLDSRGTAARRAPIWTTDAIYRETREKVEWFGERGAVAVEMECSALFAVAARRQVRAAALLVVSDSLVAKEGGWSPGFGSKQFKTMRKTACEAAVEMTGTLVK